MTEKTEWKVATDAIQAVIRLRDRVTRNKNLEKVAEIETEIKGLTAKFQKLKPIYNAAQTDLSTGGYPFLFFFLPEGEFQPQNFYLF